MNTNTDRVLDILEYNNGFQYITVMLITMLAAALRFFQLGKWSFWGDELTTVNLSLNYLQPEVPLAISLLFIKMALENIGISEFSARLVPALIGVITLPLVYFPIRTLFNPFTAIIAVLLLAVSPWHLYWSQNARFYTALFLFYNLGLILFMLVFDKKRLFLLGISISFLGLAVLERYIALFFVPILVGYLLYNHWHQASAYKLNYKRVGMLLMPGVILAVIFLPTIWNKMSDFIGQYEGAPINDPAWIFAGSVMYIGIPVFLFGILGMYSLYVQKHKAFILLFLSAMIPLIGTMALSAVMYTANRYVFVSLLAWIVLASFGLTELVKKTQSTARLLAIGSIMVVLAVSMSDNFMYYWIQHGNRADWRSAAGYISINKRPEDVVFSASPNVVSYYIDDKTYNIRNVNPGIDDKLDKRTWFILDNIALSYPPNNADWVLQNSRLMDTFDITFLARTFKMRVYLHDPNIAEH
jgi:mannosyltransferase